MTRRPGSPALAAARGAARGAARAPAHAASTEVLLGAAG